MGIFFVVRHKENLQFEVIEELELPQKKQQYVLIDQIVILKNETSKKNKYPKAFRQVVVWDEKKQQIVELITNQTKWAASTIAELYKSRWQMEIFFREIKQLLHIKSFYLCLIV